MARFVSAIVAQSDREIYVRSQCTSPAWDCGKGSLAGVSVQKIHMQAFCSSRVERL